MKYHLKFRNINERTLNATRELLQGWGEADDTLRWIKMDKWVGKASAIYGMRRPLVGVTRTAGAGYYRRDTNEIHMAYPSIVTVMHEFRHAMQAQGKAPVAITENLNAVEDDARAWSLSIYYKIAPRLFRRLVREGKILHITPDDLLARRQETINA